MTRGTLRTARLVLRAPAAGDRAAIIAQAGDREVSRWLAAVPHPYTEADADAFLARAADKTVWAIADLANDALIGTIALEDIADAAEPGTMELGYWLGRSFWGTGYASEAIAVVIAHAFACGVPAVRARYAAANAASARVLRKAGFEVVPVPTLTQTKCGAVCDVEVLLRREENCRGRGQPPGRGSPRYRM